MNIALCFSGQIRDYAFAAPSFRKYILQALIPWNTHIFIHTPDNFSPQWFCKHIDYPNDKVIVQYENELLLAIPEPVADLHAVVDRNWHQGSSLKCFYLQLRSIYKAYALSVEFATINNIHFDWVFRLRFDNLYFGEGLEDLRTLDPSAIYIPRHDNWGGYNDRFSFGGDFAMQSYCDRFTLFSTYLTHGPPMHPERFLKWTLEKNDISVKRTRVTFHLIRHRSFAPATFIPSCGDSSIPSNLWMWSVLTRLLRTRYTNLVSKFYLLFARLSAFIFQLQQR